MKDGLEYSLEYIRSGDYFIPNLTLPEETRPIGKWGANAPGVSEGVQADSVQLPAPVRRTVDISR